MPWQVRQIYQYSPWTLCQHLLTPTIGHQDALATKTINQYKNDSWTVLNASIHGQNIITLQSNLAIRTLQSGDCIFHCTLKRYIKLDLRGQKAFCLWMKYLKIFHNFTRHELNLHECKCVTINEVWKQHSMS